MKSGEKHGLLTAIEPIYLQIANKKIRTSVWKFKCDCGNDYVGDMKNILTGNTKSCGCLLFKSSLPAALQALDFIDGTCLQKIASEKIYKNNTSGVKGVSWNSGKQLWQASICFKGKSYDKRFKNREDAVLWRINMENKLFKPFLEMNRKTLSDS